MLIKFSLALVMLLIIASLFACNTVKTSTSQTSVPSTTTTTTLKPVTSTVATSVPPTSSVVSTTAGKWWDKFGTPKYGGTITLAWAFLMGVNFDTYTFVGADVNFWCEALFEPDWTLDRTIWSFPSNYFPDKYIKGNLVKSWEMSDPTTMVLHLREGVKWQNKAPVNGREFTSTDVVSHYDRILGKGIYTQPAPMFAGMASNFASVTAQDKYTISVKFKQTSSQLLQTISDRFPLNMVEAPEFAALTPSTGSDVDPKQDWHNAAGTGPWILTNYVSGSSFTYEKNPAYWGHDPRFPQNQTPYADKLVTIVIPDLSTRMAAIRTGQIDSELGFAGALIPWQQAQMMQKTNPELQQRKLPVGATGISFRIDKSPFNDIRVRQALNMAIDRKGIASSIYGGTTEGNPVGVITAEFKGLAYDYKDWPQSLKDKYAFNTSEAKKLLADAGYPNGLNTNVVAKNDQSLLPLVEAVKANLHDIGVEMEIRPMDSAAMEAYTRNAKHDQMMTNNSTYTFPPTRFIDLLYSKGSDAVFFGLNNSPDTTYDTLHDQFLAETDTDKAMGILQQMDKRVIEQFYFISVPEYYTYYIWPTTLKGYSGENADWGQQILWSRCWKE